MTALYILLGVLAFLALALILPVTVWLELEQSLSLSVRLLGFTVYNYEKRPKKRKKSAKKAQKSVQKTPQKEENPNFFKKMYKEKGLGATVNFVTSIVRGALKGAAFFVRKLKFRNFVLELTVASDDAAKTAVEYGAVNAGCYTALGALSSVSDFKIKKVDISADFNSITPRLYLAFDVKTNAFIAITAALKGCFKYRKLKKDSEKSERKQH